MGVFELKFWLIFGFVRSWFRNAVENFDVDGIETVWCAVDSILSREIGFWMN